MFGINDKVYYGRTWDEFVEFIEELEINVPEKKIIFVHNLSFEFQFFKSVFKVNNVFARKSHKVIRCELEDYNIEFRCSFTMSNCALASLPRLYKLPVEKKVGDLDYSKLRTSITELTDKEMGYCEYDCLVVYYYILQELETYERIDKIPLTNTGHVRKELKDAVMEDYSYRNKVRRSINIDPHVYNLLVECFAGGYTHANWIHADEIIENVDSWDFTSSYPYVMVTHKFPSSEFKKCNIKTLKDLNNRFAYILIVKFKDLKCKYYNNYISMSKCRYIKGARYDNGRIIQADEIEIVLTDIDFKLILDMYDCTYEITESYFSFYNYLPIQYIKFILKKYVNKTKFKGVEGKELEYMKEKNRFNSLYGMTVTNTIRDKVEYDDPRAKSTVFRLFVGVPELTDIKRRNRQRDQKVKIIKGTRVKRYYLQIYLSHDIINCKLEASESERISFSTAAVRASGASSVELAWNVRRKWVMALWNRGHLVSQSWGITTACITEPALETMRLSLFALVW